MHLLVQRTAIPIGSRQCAARTPSILSLRTYELPLGNPRFAVLSWRGVQSITESPTYGSWNKMQHNTDGFHELEHEDEDSRPRRCRGNLMGWLQ